MSQKPEKNRQPNLTPEAERELPKNRQAEQSVLAAMLIDPECVSTVLSMLKEEHFYYTAHKLIFRAILTLFNTDQPIDPVTISEILKRHKALDKIGGIPYLNSLYGSVLSSANAANHAQIVLDSFKFRQIIFINHGILQQCYNSEVNPDTLVKNMISYVSDIGNDENFTGLTLLTEYMTAVLSKIENVMQHHSPVVGISSGFYDLDRLIGGLCPGRFIVLAARPSMGKTTMMLDMASRITTEGKKVAIFSMEMETEEVIPRLFSSKLRINHDHITTGFGLKDQNLENITKEADRLSKSGFYIDPSPINTPLDIKTKVKQLETKENITIDVIMIDYLQLMSADIKKNRKNNNRQEEISDISGDLKKLAKSTKKPVLALSQLSRKLDDREDKIPRLSDLRESGAIEQDADQVIFIYRDEVYTKDKTKKPGIADIIVAKNRHGAAGSFELYFRGEYTTFDDKSDVTEQGEIFQ